MLDVQVQGNRNIRLTHQYGHSKSPENDATLVAICKQVRK